MGGACGRRNEMAAYAKWKPKTKRENAKVEKSLGKETGDCELSADGFSE